jgi:TldD protein
VRPGTGILENLRDAARRLISSPQADFLEIRLEENRTLEVISAGRNPGNTGPFIETGGMVRALRNGSWGVCSFTGKDGIVSAVDHAVRLASDPPVRGDVVLPGTDPCIDIFDPPSIEPLHDVPLREKVFLCRRYCDLLGASGTDVSARVHYSESSRSCSVINSMGTDVTERSNICGIRLEVVGDRNASVSRNLAHRGGFEYVRHRENVVEEMAEELSVHSRAEAVTPGVYMAVLDPELSGILIHEAFGHLSEADYQYSSPAVSDILEKGRRVASEAVTIVDDATHFRCPGSLAWDDEGVKGRRTVLVSDGLLTGRLHSLETAGRYGEEPTGNGRAGCFSSIPGSRMTCTYIEPGRGSKEDLLEMMDAGVYLSGAVGGATDMDSFTFTAGSAWTVRNGRLDTPLEPVTISGKVLDVLDSVVRVADDLRLCSSIGGCSRGGDRYLPVSYGGPHVLLRSLQVG